MWPSRRRRQRRGALTAFTLLDASIGSVNVGLTYARTGAIILRQQNGTLQTFATDTPGRYWDGTRHLYRVDPAFTHSFLQSHTLSSGSWAKTALNAATQSATGVNGATDSWAITETAANSEHGVSQSLSFTSGTYYTLYAVAAPRAGATRYLSLVFPSAAFTSDGIATFNLSTGAVSANATVLATGAIALANGHYLLWATALATATTSGTTLVRLADTFASAAIPSYAGDGSSGVNIWCLNATNTAYAAPLTVVNTIPIAVGTPSWSGALSGMGITLSGDFNLGADFVADVMQGSPPTRNSVQIDKGNNNDRAVIRHTAANAPRGTVMVASANSYNTAGSANDGTFAKTSLRVSAADCKLCVNTSLSAGSGAVSIPTAMTTLRVGMDSGGVCFVGGISEVRVDTVALNDAALQAATA